MRCNNDLFKKINHELIQIFQVIQGNIEKLAVEHHIDEEGWDAIDEIYGAIRRGKELSKNIAEIEKVPEELKDDNDDYLGNGETILFVDDDKQICRLYEAMLEVFNFKVIIAREGKTAIDIFCNDFQTIDLCVLDILLPDMTGYDCFKELIRCTDNDEIKVILASGSICAFDNEELNKKAKAILNKPFTLLQLTTAIKTALND